MCTVAGSVFWKQDGDNENYLRIRTSVTDP
jgi:hypothetical protein